MKKITFLFLTIALITFKTSAQDSKIKFGVQAGLNYSSFRGYDSYTDDNPGFAYLFGVSFQYQIKENLSIKADLNYERKTQKSKNVIELESYDPQNPFMPGIYHFTNTAFRNYIVLPIMVKYNFSNNKSFYVNGGPFLGYLLKSGATTTLNIEGLNNDDIDDTKFKKSLDYGLSAGIGKEFKLKGDHDIYIEIRENLGLANTSKSDYIYDNTTKTNSLNLIVGYTF